MRDHVIQSGGRDKPIESGNGANRVTSCPLDRRRVTDLLRCQRLRLYVPFSFFRASPISALEPVRPHLASVVLPSIQSLDATRCTHALFNVFDRRVFIHLFLFFFFLLSNHSAPRGVGIIVLLLSPTRPKLVAAHSTTPIDHHRDQVTLPPHLHLIPSLSVRCLFLSTHSFLSFHLFMKFLFSLVWIFFVSLQFIFGLDIMHTLTLLLSNATDGINQSRVL